MKEVKPEKSKKRLVKLPPQKSANDTSNWENRNITATTVNKVTGNRIVREVEFIENKMKSPGLTLAQIKKLEARNRTKKSSK
jgi:hypothetical protein